MRERYEGTICKCARYARMVEEASGKKILVILYESHNGNV